LAPIETLRGARLSFHLSRKSMMSAESAHDPQRQPGVGHIHRLTALALDARFTIAARSRDRAFAGAVCILLIAAAESMVRAA